MGWLLCNDVISLNYTTSTVGKTLPRLCRHPFTVNWEVKYTGESQLQRSHSKSVQISAHAHHCRSGGARPLLITDAMLQKALLEQGGPVQFSISFRAPVQFKKSASSPTLISRLTLTFSPTPPHVTLHGPKSLHSVNLHSPSVGSPAV